MITFLRVFNSERTELCIIVEDEPRTTVCRCQRLTLFEGMAGEWPNRRCAQHWSTVDLRTDLSLVFGCISAENAFHNPLVFDRQITAEGKHV